MRCPAPAYTLNPKACLNLQPQSSSTLPAEAFNDDLKQKLDPPDVYKNSTT